MTMAFSGFSAPEAVTGGQGSPLGPLRSVFGRKTLHLDLRKAN